MTATDYQIDIFDHYLDLADLQPGIRLADAATRIGCNEDTLRRAIKLAREAGDTRAPAPTRPPRDPDELTQKQEVAERKKRWTPFTGDRRLAQAAAWTCANNAVDRPELEKFLSQLGLTAKDARP